MSDMSDGLDVGNSNAYDFPLVWDVLIIMLDLLVINVRLLHCIVYSTHGAIVL